MLLAAPLASEWEVTSRRLPPRRPELDAPLRTLQEHRALELQAGGLDPNSIAIALDVDPAAIANLLRLAAAKAARARGGERAADTTGDASDDGGTNEGGQQR